MTPVVRVLLVIFFPVAFPISKLLDLILGKGHDPLFRRAELKTLVDMHGNAVRMPSCSLQFFMPLCILELQCLGEHLNRPLILKERPFCLLVGKKLFSFPCAAWKFYKDSIKIPTFISTANSISLTEFHNFFTKLFIL
jgi:hypothetical protein